MATRTRSILGVTRRLASALTGRVRSVGGPPIIISNGGGSSAAIDVDEGQTAVTTVIAVGGLAPRVYSKSGADASKFNINSSTGVLTFAAAPDYYDPQDADLDNVYEVTVTVTDDNSDTDNQDISVTVNLVPQGGSTSTFGGASYAESSFAG